MAYATIDTIFLGYPPIASMVGSAANEITSVSISSHYIANAEGLVDAYLAARYVTPLAASPLITMVTADISLFKMMEDKLPRIPEWAERRYTNAMDILKMLRDGDMILTGSQTLVTTGDQEAWSSTGSFHPIFSPVLDPLDQKVDTDYVVAEQDAREDDV